MAASDSDSAGSALVASEASSSYAATLQQPPSQQCFVCRMRFTYSGFLAHLQSDTHRENLNRHHKRNPWDEAGVSSSGGSAYKRPDPSELRLSPRLLADSDDSRLGRGRNGGSGVVATSAGGGRVQRLLRQDADRHRRTEALLAETSTKIRQFRLERGLAASAMPTGHGQGSPDQGGGGGGRRRRRRPEPVGDAAEVEDSSRTVSSDATATLSTSTTATATNVAGGGIALKLLFHDASGGGADSETSVTPLETCRSAAVPDDDFNELQRSRRLQQQLPKLLLLRDAAVATELSSASLAERPVAQLSASSTASASVMSDSATQFPTPRPTPPKQPPPPPPPPPPPAETVGVQTSPETPGRRADAGFDASSSSSSELPAVAPLSISSAVSSARRSREVERMQAALELSLQEDQVEAVIEEVDGRIGHLLEQIEELRARIDEEEAVKDQLLDKKKSLMLRRVAILKESFQYPDDISPAGGHHLDMLATDSDSAATPTAEQQAAAIMLEAMRHQLLDGVEVGGDYDDEDDAEVEDASTPEADEAAAAAAAAGVGAASRPAAPDDASSSLSEALRQRLVQKVLDTDKLARRQLKSTPPQPPPPGAVESPRDADLIESTVGKLLGVLPPQQELQQQQSVKQKFSPPPSAAPAEVLSDVLSAPSRMADKQQQRLVPQPPRPASVAAVPRRSAATVGASSSLSRQPAVVVVSDVNSSGPKRSSSETQLRRSRPRRHDPEFAAALREYLHASSSSDVDLDSCGEARGVGGGDGGDGGGGGEASTRRLAAAGVTGRSLDSSSVQQQPQPQQPPPLLSPTGSSSGGLDAAGGAASSSQDPAAPGLVYPGRFAAQADGSPVTCASVLQGFLFTGSSQDACVRRFSLRTHRCLSVYRLSSGATSSSDSKAAAAAAAVVTCLLTAPAVSAGAEPLVFWGGSDALLTAHGVHTGRLARQHRLEAPLTAACSRWGAVYLGLANGRVFKYDIAGDSLRRVVDSGGDDGASSSAVTALEAALQLPGGRRVLIRGCSAPGALLVADERNGELLADTRPPPPAAGGDEGPVLAVRVAPGSSCAFAATRRRLLAHRIGQWAEAPRVLWEGGEAEGPQLVSMHLGQRSDCLFLGRTDGSVLCCRLEQGRLPAATAVTSVFATAPGAAVTALAYYDVGRYLVCGDAAGFVTISDSLSLTAPDQQATAGGTPPPPPPPPPPAAESTDEAAASSSASSRQGLPQRPPPQTGVPPLDFGPA